MKIPFVNFGAQYLAHKEEYDEAIHKCLEKGKLILQEDVGEFEENLAKKLGMKYAVGVNSGTDALFLALIAKGVKDKEFISTSGYTFKATIEAIKNNGVYPYITDISEDRIAKDVNLPVHIEGMVCKSENAIIEDACQAIGAKGVGYSGTACYSFYPAKILGGFGDGGAVVTNDKDIYERIKLLRHHWQTNKDEKFAYNSRLDNVQAAFLNVKLKYLDEILIRREEIAEKYKELKDIVGLPIYQDGRVWQDYVIRVSDPKRLADYLAEQGIQTLGVGMTPPHIALNLGIELPNVEKLYKEMLRLPCNETLTNEEVGYIIEKVKEFYVEIL